VGFGSQVLGTTEDVLGLSPLYLHRWGDVRSFGLQGNPSGTIREERVTESTSAGTEAGRVCLQVTRRTSEVDAVR